jgi:hypothetical protein
MSDETFADHQAADPHCTCNDCIDDHARKLEPPVCPNCGQWQHAVSATTAGAVIDCVNECRRRGLTGGK